MTSDYAFSFRVAPDGSIQREWITGNSLQRITGFTPEESEARGGWIALTHPADLPLLQQNLVVLLAKPTEIRTPYRIIAKDGSIHYIAGINRSIADASGRVTYIYGAAVDVTEQTLTQQALEESERHNRSITELTSDIAFALMVRPNGTMIQDWITTDSLERVTGYMFEEIEARGDWESLVHPDDEAALQSLYKRILNDQPDSQLEYRIITKEGGTRFLKVRYSMVKDATGRLVRIYGSANDVTEQRMYAENQRERERLRIELEKEHEINTLTSRIVRMVSHDFRTPLTVILVTTYTLNMLAKKEVDADRYPEYKQKLDLIERQVTILNNYVEDVSLVLSDMAGQLQFRPTMINIGMLCQVYVEELQTTIGSDHLIRFENPDDLQTLRADERLINRILINLLSNAIKYSPRGSAIAVRLSKQGKHAILQVSDQGRGIPKDELDQLFSEYFRASNTQKITGTGLGLSIVKECIKLRNGTITVSSEVSKGTIFTVSLPLEQ